MGYYDTLNKADNTARAALRNIEAADKELARADKLVRDAEAAKQEKTLYYAKATQADAREAVTKARKDAESTLENIKGLRREIVEDEVRATSVSPEAVDMAGLELMRSGIMRPADYQIMARKYSENPTMLRLLAKHAKEAGDADRDDQARAAFWSVAHEAADKTNPERNVDGLDLIVEVFGRCIKNHAMIGHYESLTEPATGRRPEA